MTISRFTDPIYLADQYQDPGNLGARIRLHQLFSTNPSGFHPWVIEQLRLSNNSMVLEVGCGSADLWSNTLDQVSSDCRVVLTDLSPGMVKHTHRLLHSEQRFAFGLVDVQDLPFQEGTFDHVVANHILYHVPDIDKALGEIHRVLRVGGVLHAATNGEGHMQELKELSQGVDKLSDWIDVYAKFSLENGANILARWFGSVELARYQDGLEITEVEPVIDYLRSTEIIRVDQPRETEIRSLLEDRIRAHGVFRATKEIGMFSAIKEVSSDEIA